MGKLNFVGMATLKLDNDEIAEEYFDGATLFGIQCPQAPQQFVWMINKNFNYKFRYAIDTEIPVNHKGRNLHFPVFDFYEQNLSIKHVIYNNQYEGNYLLPELAHFDYIWFLKGNPYCKELAGVLSSEIKQLPTVVNSYIFEALQIRNKLRLVL